MQQNLKIEDILVSITGFMQSLGQYLFYRIMAAAQDFACILQDNENLLM